MVHSQLPVVALQLCMFVAIGGCTVDDDETWSLTVRVASPSLPALALEERDADNGSLAPLIELLQRAQGRTTTAPSSSDEISAINDELARRGAPKGPSGVYVVSFANRTYEIVTDVA